jgi:23S rRNA (guanosine2251-2'-O)-methyltransferase
MRDAPRGGGRRFSPRGAPATSEQRLYGIGPVREALRARRRELRWLRVRKGPPGPELAALVEAARAAGLPIEEVEPRLLEQGLPAGANPQGVAIGAGPLPELPLEQLVPPEGPCTLVALDGVEDPQNVGAIARVAEAAGAAGLLLTRRRAPPLSAAVARASAGAIEWLPVGRVANLPRALEGLKGRGFWVFGGDPKARDDLFQVPDRWLSTRRVLVLGAEGRGLRPGVLACLDHRVAIPLAGRVASLNVASAAAVLLFELRRRDRLATSPGIPYK